MADSAPAGNGGAGSGQALQSSGPRIARRRAAGQQPPPYCRASEPNGAKISGFVVWFRDAARGAWDDASIAPTKTSDCITCRGGACAVLSFVPILAPFASEPLTGSNMALFGVPPSGGAFSAIADRMNAELQTWNQRAHTNPKLGVPPSGGLAILFRHGRRDSEPSSWFPGERRGREVRRYNGEQHGRKVRPYNRRMRGAANVFGVLLNGYPRFASSDRCAPKSRLWAGMPRRR